MKKMKALYLFTIVYLSIGCYKDDNHITEVVIPEEPKVIIEQNSIIVNVADEEGNSLNGLTATFNNQIKIVNQASFFAFEGREVSKYNELLTITDQVGEVYEYNLHSIENQVNYYDLYLFRNYKRNSIASNLKTTIEISPDFTIHITPNNYLFNSQPYAGDVKLKYHEYDLKNEKHVLSLPGGNLSLINGRNMVINFQKAMRCEVMNEENFLLKTKQPLKIESKEALSGVLIYYDRTIHQWIYVEEINQQNHFNLSKGAGIYAIAKLSEPCLVKGIISKDLKGSSRTQLRLSNERYFKTIISGNEGFFETFVPKNEKIKLQVDDVCKDEVLTQFETNEETLDLGKLNRLDENLAYVTFNGTTIDCSNKPIKNAFLIIEQKDNKKVLFLETSKFNSSTFVCNSGDTKFYFSDENGVVSSKYVLNGNNMYLNEVVLCKEIGDDFLLLSSDDDQHILYKEVQTKVEENKVQIYYKNGGNTEVNLYMPHHNAVEEIISPGINLDWFDQGYGNYGVDFQCVSSTDCGFESLHYTTFEAEGGYIRGKCKGRLWLKTLNPVKARYLNITGVFQLKNK